LSSPGIVVVVVVVVVVEEEGTKNINPFS